MVSLSCSMELVDEKPKRKRGRPKKGSQVKDAQGNTEHSQKGMTEHLLLTDQKSNEKFLLYNEMITGPKKRGRPKKLKCGFPKKESTTQLPKVDAPSVFQLCLEDPLLEEEFNPYGSFSDIDLREESVDSALMMSAENVDPDQLALLSAEDVISRNKEKLIEEPNEADNATDICASIRRCSVQLERLAENEKDKYLNCSMGVEEPRDKPTEKNYLLENLGNFLRYKGSSTRGNFLNSFHSPDNAQPWCLKFSDDSSDEDYFPGKQFPNDDLDWNPTVKSLKRKSSKKVQAHTKVKRAKHNKVDHQVSAKLNYSSADNSSLTSTDNSSTETRSSDLYSSGKLDHPTKPEHVNPTQTNSCFPTNLTRVSKMNPSRIPLMKRYPQLMTELQVTQSSTGLEVKQEHYQCQTSNCPSRKTIEIIDISSDLEEEPMKTVLTSDFFSSTESTDVSKHENVQIAPIKLETNVLILNVDESRSILKEQRKRTKSQVLRNSSCASNDSEKVMNTSEISSRQVTLKKQETYLKWKKIVGKSSPSLKQQKYSKMQVSEMTRDRSLKLVPKKNDSQSIAGSLDAISPCDINVQRKHSKDGVSQTRNCASNTLTTDDIPEEKSSRIAPMKGDSKLKTLGANKFQTMRNIQRTLQSILKKKKQPSKQVSQVCVFPSNRLTNASGNKLNTVSMKQDNQLVPEAPAEELPNIRKDEASQISNEIDNVSEEDSYISNSLTNRSEQKVEDLSVSLTSDTFDECSAHCNSFSCNLDDDNAPTPLAGCIYCKNFAELDAIASLAAADLDEDPKAYIECEIESTEAMYDKLKVEQPQDDEVALKLKKIAFKNRGLKYGRDFLSSYGSFINVSECFLKSIDLAVAREK